VRWVARQFGVVRGASHLCAIRAHDQGTLARLVWAHMSQWCRPGGAGVYVWAHMSELCRPGGACVYVSGAHVRRGVAPTAGDRVAPSAAPSARAPTGQRPREVWPGRWDPVRLSGRESRRGATPSEGVLPRWALSAHTGHRSHPHQRGCEAYRHTVCAVPCGAGVPAPAIGRTNTPSAQCSAARVFPPPKWRRTDTPSAQGGGGNPPYAWCVVVGLFFSGEPESGPVRARHDDEAPPPGRARLGDKVAGTIGRVCGST
jgi:hypothetical protein